ncbi:hypothetical protein B9Z55_022691 [Caenorhabditis nigoni]|uniref:Uncharacterized protein n=2 Tax=Caenorhabditis nigoni TaxID=1611254 RepID=A0A2G5SLY4_9PELO|nr:hypothetical protein B9Z55_022691 [Caenorhabditis nigoni]
MERRMNMACHGPKGEPTCKRPRPETFRRGNHSAEEHVDQRMLRVLMDAPSGSFNGNRIRLPIRLPAHLCPRNISPSENDENSGILVNRSAGDENTQGRQSLAIIDEDSPSYVLDDHKNNLWPNLFAAIQTFRYVYFIQKLKWTLKARVHEDLMKDYENGLEYLLGQKKPVGPFKTKEQVTALEEYLSRRKAILIEAAKEYHDGNESCPGLEHELGHLFPVKTSHNMIEYLKVAFQQFNYDGPIHTSNVDYPEIQELTPQAREIMELSICNHKSVESREILINMVAKTQELTDNNMEALNELITEMNFMFDRNFECNIIREAKEARAVDAQRRQRIVAQNRAAERARVAQQAGVASCTCAYENVRKSLEAAKAAKAAKEAAAAQEAARLAEEAAKAAKLTEERENARTARAAAAKKKLDDEDSIYHNSFRGLHKINRTTRYGSQSSSPCPSPKV